MPAQSQKFFLSSSEDNTVLASSSRYTTNFNLLSNGDWRNLSNGNVQVSVALSRKVKIKRTHSLDHTCPLSRIHTKDKTVDWQRRLCHGMRLLSIFQQTYIVEFSLDQSTLCLCLSVRYFHKVECSQFVCVCNAICQIITHLTKMIGSYLTKSCPEIPGHRIQYVDMCGLHKNMRRFEVHFRGVLASIHGNQIIHSVCGTSCFKMVQPAVLFYSCTVVIPMDRLNQTFKKSTLKFLAVTNCSRPSRAILSRRIYHLWYIVPMSDGITVVKKPESLNLPAPVLKC